MTCEAKHTKYQPSDDEWLCPKCGANNAFFYIEESAGSAEDECEKVHKEDLITCTKCGYGDTGEKVTKLMAKKDNLITCPCCKGKGMVKGDSK